MKNINLLPWRHLQRVQRRQNFYYLLGVSLLFTSLLLVSIHGFVAKAITKQALINNNIRQKIAVHARQIKELNTIVAAQRDLVAQLQIIHLLKIQQLQTVSLLTELGQIIPAGLRLTSITQDHDQLLITGEAQVDIQISKFMQNLDKAKWLTHPQLIEINHDIANFMALSSFKIIAQAHPGHATLSSGYKSNLPELAFVDVSADLLVSKDTENNAH